jgi:tRNA-Thr(GGU) m(6)t(6)A37 methyltransferase TsaA
MSPNEEPSLSIQPIGYVRTASRFKFDAPSQPDATSLEVNRIELFPGKQFELALQDLDGFDKIWVVSWFDRNQHWRPRVMPPRGPATRRGVFSTRSPHRPNPIGLTCVSLIKVDGLILEVGPLDLVDGTPILDIKPYLRTVDCHPNASLGWIEAIEAQENTEPAFRIVIMDLARTQLDWLKDNWGVDFTERAFRILRRDPTPHRTRRILQIDDNRYRIACGAWRLYFRIEKDEVVVEEINRGYKEDNLMAPGREKILDREAQIAFAERFNS